MNKLSYEPLCGKKENKWENVGHVLYSFHDYSHIGEFAGGR